MKYIIKYKVKSFNELEGYYITDYIGTSDKTKATKFTYFQALIKLLKLTKESGLYFSYFIEKEN